MISPGLRKKTADYLKSLSAEELHELLGEASGLDSISRAMRFEDSPERREQKRQACIKGLGTAAIIHEANEELLGDGAVYGEPHFTCSHELRTIADDVQSVSERPKSTPVPYLAPDGKPGTRFKSLQERSLKSHLAGLTEWFIAETGSSKSAALSLLFEALYEQSVPKKMQSGRHKTDGNLSRFRMEYLSWKSFGEDDNSHLSVREAYAMGRRGETILDAAMPKMQNQLKTDPSAESFQNEIRRLIPSSPKIHLGNHIRLYFQNVAGIEKSST